MSKYDAYPIPTIADLLEKLCPEGVQQVELREVLKHEQPGKYQVQSTNYDPHAPTPVLTPGKGFILGYTYEKDGIFPASAESPVIIFDDFTTNFHWVDFPFKVKSSAMKVLHINSDLANFRFVYWAMKSIAYRPSEHARQWIQTYSKLQIPLPPLEVQEQIVASLDIFTDLGANLNRELALRKTQIEICLGDIFASDEISNSHSVPLGHLLRHIQPGKYQVTSTEYDPSAPTPVLSPGKAFLLGYTDETDGIFEASPDDPTIIFDDFTTNFHWVDFPFKVKSSAMKMLVPRSDDFVFRYAYWAMKTIPYKPTEHQRQWLQTYSRFEIPLPPLDVQERIVGTLDMFTDYTDNLRREIDLRRQQLEYYRGKLLTFPVAE